jgi:hypothetical protein
VLLLARRRMRNTGSLSSLSHALVSMAIGKNVFPHNAGKPPVDTLAAEGRSLPTVLPYSIGWACNEKSESWQSRGSLPGTIRVSPVVPRMDAGRCEPRDTGQSSSSCSDNLDREPVTTPHDHDLEIAGLYETPVICPGSRHVPVGTNPIACATRSWQFIDMSRRSRRFP